MKINNNELPGSDGLDTLSKDAENVGQTYLIEVSKGKCARLSRRLFITFAVGETVLAGIQTVSGFFRQYPRKKGGSFKISQYQKDLAYAYVLSKPSRKTGANEISKEDPVFLCIEIIFF